MSDANPDEGGSNHINPFAQWQIPIVILDEEDPSEASEEYMPLGHLEDSSATQDQTESLTDEEYTPQTPSPHPTPCCPGGYCPLTHEPVHTAIPPVAERAPRPHRHYEVGGPSRAVPPPAPPAVTPPPAATSSPPRDAPTMAQHRHLANQVLQLQDARKEDSSTIQTMRSRAGTDRTHTNVIGAHMRGFDYRLEIAEQELQASERHRLQIQRQLDELTRFVRRRLG